MIDPTPKVSSRYGAPMGRRSDAYLETCAGKFYLRHVRLDAGGYDSGGAYWGHHLQLWCVQDQDSNIVYLRAATRKAAKALVLDDWPDATFYR